MSIQDLRSKAARVVTDTTGPTNVGTGQQVDTSDSGTVVINGDNVTVGGDTQGLTLNF